MRWYRRNSDVSSSPPAASRSRKVIKMSEGGTGAVTMCRSHEAMSGIRQLTVVQVHVHVLSGRSSSGIGRAKLMDAHIRPRPRS